MLVTLRPRYGSPPRRIRPRATALIGSRGRRSSISPGSFRSSRCSRGSTETLSGTASADSYLSYLMPKSTGSFGLLKLAPVRLNTFFDFVALNRTATMVCRGQIVEHRPEKLPADVP